uniref:Centrosomin N-terminal motif 1 domain-containing protein n=1 Tax=Sinocyclocheilus grahami TaxID=75366 RepID=A0A672LFV1_SINGR
VRGMTAGASDRWCIYRCCSPGDQTDGCCGTQDGGVIFTHTHTHTHTLPPDMSNTYRTLSQHLNDLKKENFSLKLRIYFLEERIQQKFEDGSDEIYRTNIELKVEVESLKQELQEKQQLLDKSTAAATLTWASRSQHQGPSVWL